nr:hypothetical protein [Tanacetum cinerariifolium]
MATTIEQQVALDEALVPNAQRLRIGRSNFRLPSDIQSKESTLQVVYDVLRRSPFFKAFIVTADVPEIYMQELWATAYVHQHSIKLKMDTRKNFVDLEAFREMLHISPRVPGQSFAELPFEEEILEFFRFLRHSAQIKTLTDVNINKLFQPWRSFAAVINKCLTGKSSGIDSLRLSQAQIFWGLYLRRNVDYAFLIWEDFVYQVEQKNQKKSNEMYYPRFTKVIIHHFMTKKPSIPRRNKNTQQYGAILPIELTTEDIRNTKAYKEYYAYATGEAVPKPKASAKRKIDEAEKVNDDDDDEEEISNIDEQEATESGEGDDEETKSDRESEEEKIRKHEEESFDPIPRTLEDGEDDGNGEEDQGLRISEEERMHKEEKADELYHDSSSMSSFVTSLLNPIVDPGMESIFTTASTSVTPLPSPTSTMTPSIITTTRTASRPPILPTPIPKAVSNIPGIVHQYMHQEMTQAVREAVQIQKDQLQDSLQRENDEFIRTIDDNMKKIIKEQVKSQVKAQVTRILPRIEESVNAQLEAEVLTRSSHSSRTSYAVAADLSEMELKKILIDKMEGNKSIQRSDEQQNFYKALEGPSVGSDRGSKRRREGGEHASANTLSEPATTSADSAQSWISKLAKQTDARSSFNELLDTPIDFFNFIMNWLGVDTLTPELLAGPTYELMRGSCNSLTKLGYHLEEVYKATTDQLDWVVSRHHNTQQYGAILHIELTNEDIRNTKAYKEYFAYASGEAAPKPKAKLARTEAQQLKIVLKRSRHEKHISQHGGSGTDEGNGSKPGVPDVPSDDSKEEISWNSSKDEETDTQAQDRHDDE